MHKVHWEGLDRRQEFRIGHVECFGEEEEDLRRLGEHEWAGTWRKKDVVWHKVKAWAFGIHWLRLNPGSAMSELCDFRAISSL